MAAYYDDRHHIEISEDEARSGVTGHNVRYVLGFGMTGVIAAFAAIAIYLGFDRLHQAILTAATANPSEALRAFAPYGAIVLFGAIGAGLLLGVWTLIAGHSDDGSQRFMRARVVAQFALVCVVMAIFYVAR